MLGLAKDHLRLVTQRQATGLPAPFSSAARSLVSASHFSSFAACPSLTFLDALSPSVTGGAPRLPALCVSVTRIVPGDFIETQAQLGSVTRLEGHTALSGRE